MLTAIDTRIVALAVAAFVLIAGEAGFWFARRYLASDGNVAHLGVVQGAAFGILGLLLAFSFSVGLARYDARRVTVVHEANAIGKAWLRTDLLNETAARVIRAKLKVYTDERLAFIAPDVDLDQRARAAMRSATLQQEMWGIVMRAEDRRLPITNLLVQALNDMIDVSAEQAALLGEQVPQAVLVVLIATSLIAATLLGAGYGQTRRHGLAAQVMVALILAIVIATIFDLDRPQHGLIRVDLEPLRAAQRSMIVR